VLLLSRNEAYAVRTLVTVAPVTTRIRRLPVEVALGRAEGLPKRCVANLDTVTTIPKRRLIQPAGAVSPKKMAEVDRALCFALGLDEAAS